MHNQNLKSLSPYDLIAKLKKIYVKQCDNDMQVGDEFCAIL